MNQNIEAYLDGTLDPETVAAFEAQLAQDTALQEAVAAAQRMRQDLDWMAVEQGLKQGEQAFWDKKKRRKKRERWLLLAIGFLFLLMIGIWGALWTKKTAEESPKQQDLPDSLPAMPRDNPPQHPNETQSNFDSIMTAQNSLIKRLFAENFKPYKEESLDPSLRGESVPTPSEKFQQLYWEGKYREALTQFSAMPATSKTNDNLLFLKAECLMALGKTEEALPIYESILKRDRTRYMDAVAWHRALANLKMGNSAQAKAQLLDIGRSGSKWRAAAVALLKSIQ